MNYKGSCHCQAIQFEIECDPIVSGLQCNCSVCIRKNAIMSLQYIASENFKLISGKESLSIYQWGDEDVNHYFCKTCGIYPFHDVKFHAGKYRVNLGCVDGINPRKLIIQQFDGENEL